jgi:lysophospholipase L1-like esterase
MIPQNRTIVFMGDSITDASHDGLGEPTPWMIWAGLGRGYVGLVYAWITASRPADKLRIINRGMSGRTVREIKEAWGREVTEVKPQWVSLMIGINDVWRHFDSPLRKECHVGIEEYESTLDALLTAHRPSLEGMVLVAPYVIEPNRQEPMRVMMDQYGEVVRKLAAKHSAILVDTQTAFDEVNLHRHPMEIAWDRIHPDSVGHMVIAQAWLKATGYLPDSR